jgi:hypothetical protein
MVNRILAPINHAKTCYVVADPRDAVDFRTTDDPMGSWTDYKVMEFEKVDNVILLSQAHVGKTLTHYNLDLVPGYIHNMVYDQDAWKVIIKAMQDSLPDHFARRCAILAETGLLTNAQRKHVNNLQEWPSLAATSSASSSGGGGHRPRPGEIRSR